MSVIADRHVQPPFPTSPATGARTCLICNRLQQCEYLIENQATIETCGRDDERKMMDLGREH